MASHRDFTATVEPGLGLGENRMEHPGVLDRLRELVGFPVIPGTLNVRLPGPFNPPAALLYLAADDIDPGWEAQTGQTGYFFAPVIIAGRYRGVAMQAEEPGYPADLVELICEVHLRQTLRLTDGDQVAFSTPDTWADPGTESEGESRAMLRGSG